MAVGSQLKVGNQKPHFLKEKSEEAQATSGVISTV